MLEQICLCISLMVPFKKKNVVGLFICFGFMWDSTIFIIIFFFFLLSVIKYSIILLY